ncbi:MAG: tRNA (N6-threonylcarbamoyladenosine(37)-N6)-methyltransferase TrmO, partial [Bradyrhizobium sp.]
MSTDTDLRPGEITVDVPPPHDAALYFIGRIRTPWTSRLDTPRQGSPEGPVCRLEIFEPWVPAL